MPRLVLLSGPSCVGKGPLVSAIRKFRPDVKFGEVPVIKSLESRPGGLRPSDDPRDFLGASRIRELSSDPRYVVDECRGLPQAIDLERLKEGLKKSPTLFAEVYYTLGRQFELRPNILWASREICDLEVISVFLSPVSQEDKRLLPTSVTPLNVVTNMMRAQVARAIFQGKTLTDAFVRDCFSRAADSINEIGSAHLFKRVLVNNEPEGSHFWLQAPDGSFLDDPTAPGKAPVIRDLVSAFASVLEIPGSQSAQADHMKRFENWTNPFFPGPLGAPVETDPVMIMRSLHNPDGFIRPRLEIEGEGGLSMDARQHYVLSEKYPSDPAALNAAFIFHALDHEHADGRDVEHDYVVFSRKVMLDLVNKALSSPNYEASTVIPAYRESRYIYRNDDTRIRSESKQSGYGTEIQILLRLTDMGPLVAMVDLHEQKPEFDNKEF